MFDWKERTLKQRIDLGAEGVMPLEIRFLHNPKKAEVKNSTGMLENKGVRLRDFASVTGGYGDGESRNLGTTFQIIPVLQYEDN